MGATNRKTVELMSEMAMAVRRARNEADDQGAVRAIVVRPDVALDLYQHLTDQKRTTPPPTGKAFGYLDRVELRCAAGLTWRGPQDVEPPRYELQVRTTWAFLYPYLKH